MSAFVPEGYLPIIEAFRQALEHWFGGEIASTKKRIIEESAQVKAIPSGDSVRDALIADGLSEDVGRRILEACQELFKETLHRLRNALHKGEITAFYFSTTHDDPHSIRPAYWATPAADDVIDSGIYSPFWHPRAQVLIREKDLQRLLSGERDSSGNLRKVSHADLRAFVLSNASSELTSSELEKKAKEHFKGKHFPRKMWRDTYADLPSEQKRSPGETNRTLRARRRSVEE
jgi:hypothetical protein